MLTMIDLTREDLLLLRSVSSRLERETFWPSDLYADAPSFHARLLSLQSRIQEALEVAGRHERPRRGRSRPSWEVDSGPEPDDSAVQAAMEATVWRPAAPAEPAPAPVIGPERDLDLDEPRKEVAPCS
jgi:hypothetical protein